MGYSSGNVGLGESVAGWADIIEGLLLAEGWTLVYDNLPAGAASGYRVYRIPPISGLTYTHGNGPNLLVYIDGTTTTFQACAYFQPSPFSFRDGSRLVTRTHDLANGFAFFADVGPDHITMFFETVDGVQTPITFGAAAPAWVSPIYTDPNMRAARRGLSGLYVPPVPRCWVAEPAASTFLLSNLLCITGYLNDLSGPEDVWRVASMDLDGVTGDLFNYAYHVSHQLESGQSNDSLDDYNDVFSPELIRSVWQCTAQIGQSSQMTNSNGNLVYAPGLIWDKLPGYYRTNSAASNKVGILTDTRSPTDAEGRNALVDDITDTATSFKLSNVTGGTAADIDTWPSTGFVRIENEWVEYATKTLVAGGYYEFGGVSRGLYGTAAASHVGFAPAGQPLLGDGSARAGLGEWWVKSGQAALYAGYTQP